MPEVTPQTKQTDDLFVWAEDLCEVCGAHVGYGIKLFHLGRCDAHAESDEPTDRIFNEHGIAIEEYGPRGKRDL